MTGHLALFFLLIWTNVANVFDGNKESRRSRKLRFYNAGIHFAITGRFPW